MQIKSRRSSTMSDKATLAEVARSLFAEPTVALTLQRIVDRAAETVDGCDGAGLILVGKREIVAGAWSNELAGRSKTWNMRSVKVHA